MKFNKNLRTVVANTDTETEAQLKKLLTTHFKQFLGPTLKHNKLLTDKDEISKFVENFKLTPQVIDTLYSYLQSKAAELVENFRSVTREFTANGTVPLSFWEDLIKGASNSPKPVDNPIQVTRDEKVLIFQEAIKQELRLFLEKNDYVLNSEDLDSATVELMKLLELTVTDTIKSALTKFRTFVTTRLDELSSLVSKYIPQSIVEVVPSVSLENEILGSIKKFKPEIYDQRKDDISALVSVFCSNLSTGEEKEYISILSEVKTLPQFVNRKILSNLDGYSLEPMSLGEIVASADDIILVYLGKQEQLKKQSGDPEEITQDLLFANAKAFVTEYQGLVVQLGSKSSYLIDIPELYRGIAAKFKESFHISQVSTLRDLKKSCIHFLKEECLKYRDYSPNFFQEVSLSRRREIFLEVVLNQSLPEMIRQSFPSLGVADAFEEEILSGASNPNELKHNAYLIASHLITEDNIFGKVISQASMEVVNKALQTENRINTSVSELLFRYFKDVTKDAIMEMRFLVAKSVLQSISSSRSHSRFLTRPKKDWVQQSLVPLTEEGSANRQESTTEEVRQTIAYALKNTKGLSGSFSAVQDSADTFNSTMEEDMKTIYSFQRGSNSRNFYFPKDVLADQTKMRILGPLLEKYELTALGDPSFAEKVAKSEKEFQKEVGTKVKNFPLALDNPYYRILQNIHNGKKNTLKRITIDQDFISSWIVGKSTPATLISLIRSAESWTPEQLNDDSVGIKERLLLEEIQKLSKSNYFSLPKNLFNEDEEILETNDKLYLFNAIQKAGSGLGTAFQALSKETKRAHKKEDKETLLGGTSKAKLAHYFTILADIATKANTLVKNKRAQALAAVFPLPLVHDFMNPSQRGGAGDFSAIDNFIEGAKARLRLISRSSGTFTKDEDMRLISRPSGTFTKDEDMRILLAGSPDATMFESLGYDTPKLDLILKEIEKVYNVPVASESEKIKLYNKEYDPKNTVEIKRRELVFSNVLKQCRSRLAEQAGNSAEDVLSSSQEVTAMVSSLLDELKTVVRQITFDRDIQNRAVKSLFAGIVEICRVFSTPPLEIKGKENTYGSYTLPSLPINKSDIFTMNGLSLEDMLGGNDDSGSPKALLSDFYDSSVGFYSKSQIDEIVAKVNKRVTENRNVLISSLIREQVKDASSIKGASGEYSFTLNLPWEAFGEKASIAEKNYKVKISPYYEDSTTPLPKSAVTWTSDDLKKIFGLDEDNLNEIISSYLTTFLSSKNTELGQRLGKTEANMNIDLSTIPGVVGGGSSLVYVTPKFDPVKITDSIPLNKLGLSQEKLDLIEDTLFNPKTTERAVFSRLKALKAEPSSRPANQANSEIEALLNRINSYLEETRQQVYKDYYDEGLKLLQGEGVGSESFTLEIAKSLIDKPNVNYQFSSGDLTEPEFNELMRSERYRFTKREKRIKKAISDLSKMRIKLESSNLPINSKCYEIASLFAKNTLTLPRFLISELEKISGKELRPKKISDYSVSALDMKKNLTMSKTIKNQAIKILQIIRVLEDLFLVTPKEPNEVGLDKALEILSRETDLPGLSKSTTLQDLFSHGSKLAESKDKDLVEILKQQLKISSTGSTSDEYGNTVYSEGEYLDKANAEILTSSNVNKLVPLTLPNMAELSPKIEWTEPTSGWTVNHTGVVKKGIIRIIPRAFYTEDASRVLYAR